MEVLYQTGNAHHQHQHINSSNDYNTHGSSQATQQLHAQRQQQQQQQCNTTTSSTRPVSAASSSHVHGTQTHFLAEQTVYHDNNTTTAMRPPSKQHQQFVTQIKAKPKSELEHKEQQQQMRPNVSSSSATLGTSRNFNDQAQQRFNASSNINAAYPQQQRNEAQSAYRIGYSPELRLQLEQQEKRDRELRQNMSTSAQQLQQQQQQFAGQPNDSNFLANPHLYTLQDVWQQHHQPAAAATAVKPLAVNSKTATNTVHQMMLDDHQSSTVSVVDFPTGAKPSAQVSSLAVTNSSNVYHQQAQVDNSLLNNGANVQQPQQQYAHNLLDYSLNQFSAEQLAEFAATGSLSPNTLMNFPYVQQQQQQQYAPDSTNLGLDVQRQATSNPTSVQINQPSIAPGLAFPPAQQPQQYNNMLYNPDPNCLTAIAAACMSHAASSSSTISQFSQLSGPTYGGGGAAAAAAAAANGGPIQLWQFLLEMLIDKNCQQFICWTGQEWEFKLLDPDEVAKRWGLRKNKHKMNYEKLSRGLRYYYDKKIIKKTTGKRYVYKFVCDLETMFGGIKPHELHQMVGIGPPQAIGLNEANVLGEFNNILGAELLNANVVASAAAAAPAANASPSMASTASSSASSSSMPSPPEQANSNELPAIDNDTIGKQKRTHSASERKSPSELSQTRPPSSSQSIPYNNNADASSYLSVHTAKYVAQERQIVDTSSMLVATSSSGYSPHRYVKQQQQQQQQPVTDFSNSY